MSSFGFQTTDDGLVIEGLSADANTISFEKKLSASDGTTYTESMCEPAGATGYSASADKEARLVKYNFTCPSWPIIFICPTTESTAGQPTRPLGIEHVSGTTYNLWIQTPNGTVDFTSSGYGTFYTDAYSSTAESNDYYIFSQTVSNGADSHGMRMWDSGGNLTFDSSNVPLNLKTAVLFNTNIALGQSQSASYSSIGMTKPAYLLRQIDANYTHFGYYTYYTNFVSTFVHHMNPFVTLYNGKIYIQWYLSSHVNTGFPGTYSNGAWNNYKLAVGLLAGRGIDIEVDSSNVTVAGWDNTTFEGNYFPMIDGADYD